MLTNTFVLECGPEQELFTWSPTFILERSPGAGKPYMGPDTHIGTWPISKVFHMDIEP